MHLACFQILLQGCVNGFLIMQLFTTVLGYFFIVYENLELHKEVYV